MQQHQLPDSGAYFLVIDLKGVYRFDRDKSSLGPI